MHFSPPRFASLRSLFVLLCGLAVLAWAPLASAAGKVIWKSTTVEERTDSGSWRLDIELHLPSAPNVAHVPMKFEFVPTAYYERSLNDGQDKPQERTVPLTGQQPLIESVDVGFMDPGSGQVQARTRFTFKVTRAHGYEAGEYKVTIRDTTNDRVVGTPTTLKFRGQNEVIDRRSMVFQPSERKKKKTEEKKEEAASAPSEDDAPSSSAEEPEEPEGAAAEPPPAVEERPGGGCHLTPSYDGGQLSWMFLALALAAGTWARRRA